MSDDGGSVFPSAERWERVPSNSWDEFAGGTFSIAARPGLSLRDYFIANAPHRPQVWFQPIMPRECPPEIATKDAVLALQAWNAEYLKQLHVQWPAAWADEMLKARQP